MLNIHNFIDHNLIHSSLADLAEMQWISYQYRLFSGFYQVIQVRNQDTKLMKCLDQDVLRPSIPSYTTFLDIIFI